MQNNASWHKRCHQKFNTSMLERAKKGQKRKGSSDGRTACRHKRKPNLMSTTCIFCAPSYCMNLPPLTWIRQSGIWPMRCPTVICL